MNTLKSGIAVLGKWMLSHKKVVVGAFLGIAGIIGAALRFKKGTPEAIEAGEDPDLLESGEETEEVKDEETSEETKE